MVFKHKDNNETIDKLVDALDKVYEHFKPENQAKLMYQEFEAHMKAYQNTINKIKLNDNGKIKEEDVDDLVEDYLLNFISTIHGERGKKIAEEIKDLFKKQNFNPDDKFEYLSKVLPSLTGISPDAIEQVRNRLKEVTKYSKFNGDELKREISYHLHHAFHEVIENSHPIVNLYNSKIFNEHVLSVSDYYQPGVIAEALKKKSDAWNLYIKDDTKAKGLLPMDLYQIIPNIAQGSKLPEQIKEKYGLSHEK